VKEKNGCGEATHRSTIAYCEHIVVGFLAGRARYVVRMDSTLDELRRSWNHATRNHNAHKGDQAKFLREGGDTLFDEELALLGELAGKSVVHLQCNAGQDSLCLARRGAHVTGVDLADEAIAFARSLSAASGIAAHFVEGDVVQWCMTTEARFDIAFTSYGTTGWLPDLDAWARGVARILRPGGMLVYVEFHPLRWSFDDTLGLTKDDYFETRPFRDPVGDYVLESGAALGVVKPSESLPNETPATSWQHGLGEIVTAICRAGLVLECLEEFPHSNGSRPFACAVLGEDRRYRFPEGKPRFPLMFGLRARKPRADHSEQIDAG
jgi:SAM-dependent methyltransferase